MLLRSSSTPPLNSLCGRDSHHEPESNASVSVSASRIPRNRSLCKAICSKIGRVASESNLKAMCGPVAASRVRTEWEDEEVVETLERLFLRSRLVEEEEGCGVGGGGGRRNCGGGGGGEYWDSDHGIRDPIEVYYESVIKVNPGNSLLLSNYAKYLEVRGDLVRAEEYCGRAILADPSDGDMLAFYAELIWKTEKHAARAETYFDQAVKAAPDDCYVMASYAKLLWDTEEDEKELNSSSVLSAPVATSGDMWQAYQDQAPPIPSVS